MEENNKMTIFGKRKKKENNDPRNKDREVSLSLLLGPQIDGEGRRSSLLGVRGLATANFARTADYGGKQAIDAAYNVNYKLALENPDSYLSRIISNGLLESEKKDKDGNPIPFSGNISADYILSQSGKIYEETIDSIKVSDVLSLLRLPPKNYGEMTKYADLYMDELKEKDKDVYKKLKSLYLTSSYKSGVLESMTQYNNANTMRGLEELVNPAPKEDKGSEEKEKKK